MQIEPGERFRSAAVDRGAERIKRFRGTFLRGIDQTSVFLARFDLLAHFGDRHAAVQKFGGIVERLDRAFPVALPELERGIGHHDALIGVGCGAAAGRSSIACW